MSGCEGHRGEGAAPKSRHAAHGFTLMELMVALAISSVLITGLLQVVLAATSSFALQQGLGQMQEHARFLTAQLTDAIRPAGFHPQPWLDAANASAVGAGSAEAVSLAGDRLEVLRWSDRNCFDNPNPATDGNGMPLYQLRITAFEVVSGQLVLNCRYGPDPTSLVTQVNNLGLAGPVDAFEVQFAEDADADGQAERWVPAGQWQVETGLRAVRFAFVLATPEPVQGSTAGPLQLLGSSYTPPGDGRLRRAYQGTVALAGRLP